MQTTPKPLSFALEVFSVGTGTRIVPTLQTTPKPLSLSLIHI